MALEANAKHTEHNGAKNMSHDKPAKRADLKGAARKLRRQADKRIVAVAVATTMLTGCTHSFQYARDQGGGCLASTLVGATAGGLGGATIGAGTGQLAAIGGGVLLGGTLGYGINPACHEDPGYPPAQPIDTK